jgi:hypothetical protein
VTFGTQLLVANQTRQQTIALARGTASQRLQQADAAMMVTAQTVGAEMYAYGNLSAEVDLNTDESLAYIWWSDQEATQGTGKEFLVGVNPQSYIRGT